MKKTIIFLLSITPVLLFGQAHSWDGKGIKPNGKAHYINVFVNIIYDVHPDTNNTYNNTTYWPPVTDPAMEGINTTAIPTYLLDWMDTVYVPGQMHGTVTRLYGESSFDTLQITGDFMVMNIKESTVLDKGSFNFLYMSVEKMDGFVLDLLGQTPSLSLFTHRPFSDFAYRNYLIRNITRTYGGLNPGSGSSLLGNTLQCVGDGDISTNPTGIVTHEISHGLFGDNSFHTSGGNHRYVDNTKMAFLNIQGGHGLMGAANSGLVGCNGYERWRMHWKHPSSVDYIAARDAANTQSVPSDISMEDGDKTFLLRDFVTYGDAVRIKLPYKDSVTSSNQYIWLENHQVGLNGKLDFLQYSNTESCRPQGTAGIYAYYQIGRDVIEGPSDIVWDNSHRDNLKVIPAEGYYDYRLVPDTYNIACVAYRQIDQAVMRGAANPLCGWNDQEKMLFPEDGENVLYVTREVEPCRIVKNGQNYDNLPFLGDNLDAFSTHAKINMGTNPSTNNAKTCHSRNRSDGIIHDEIAEKNVRTTYLTGLGIEMTPVAGTGNFLVSIRWDDYDITDDCRWTGDIALKDTAVLTLGKTITLAQNRTVAQTTRDAETGLFAGRTRWICETGSYLRQENASTIRLTEGSSLVFESGSRFVQAFDASMEVGAGCTLRFGDNANVVLRGILEVDSGGVCYMADTVGMGATARIIVHPGGKLVVDGGTLTSVDSGGMWQGVEVWGHRNRHQTAADQGTLELRNGAVIENALCGVRTGRGSDSLHTTGGIVTAENSTFRNCAKAVEFLPYTDTIANGLIASNHGGFTNCTFTVDDNNLFAAGNASFTAHATLCQVKGVEFLGCTFLNLTSSPLYRGRAIYAQEAGFTVDEYCDYQQLPPVLPGVCGCLPEYSDSCLFEGFATAIDAGTAGTPFAVTVNRARFANNSTSVRINANNFATVTECDFDLTDCETFGKQACGLNLDNCSGYKVEGNAFYRDSYPNPVFGTDNHAGVQVTASGSAANSIYRNGFTNLTKGIAVSGSNGGLQIGCNGFTNNSYDIHIPAGASVAMSQGTLSAGADNVFEQTRVSSIYNASGQKLIYRYSAGNGHAPYSPYNVMPDATATANDCASTLCGVFPPPVNLASFPTIPSPQATEPPTNTDEYLSAEPPASTDGLASTDPPTNTDASAMYYAAVHALMSDSLLDMAALEQWHAAAQPIADPYSLAETRFALGYDEDFTIPTIPSPQATEPPTNTDGLPSAEPQTTTADFSDYVLFHNLKRSLRDDDGNTIDWYALAPAQIAQLQDIAENGTGRAAVMARSALCFFFGICLDDDNQPVADLRRAGAKDGEGYMPVLTDDTVSFSIAYHIVTYINDYNPWCLGAQSFKYVSQASDTVTYNNNTYRYFGWNLGNGIQTPYLREDNLTGRLFRYFPENDTEVMTCDMSLTEGDTFYLPSFQNIWYWELQQEYVIVDSVTYHNGRKTIWFPPFEDSNFFGTVDRTYPLCFIEGVGPTYGPYGLEARGGFERALGLLLCVHHNDSLVYMTDPVLGCEQYVVSVPEYSDVSMKLYPNPTGDILNVEFEGIDDPQGLLTVTDLAGVVVLTQACHAPVIRLNVSHLAPGLYVVGFRNEKGVVVRKFVKM